MHVGPPVFLGDSVGDECPHYKRASARLVAEVHFVKHAKRRILQASQFPDALTDSKGTFHKPLGW